MADEPVMGDNREEPEDARRPPFPAGPASGPENEAIGNRPISTKRHHLHLL